MGEPGGLRRLDGRATQVRHTVQVLEDGNRTDHIVLFDVGGERVTFRGRSPVLIEEGDEVAVVLGEDAAMPPHVLAFVNRTRGIRGPHVQPAGCSCFAVYWVVLFGGAALLSGAEFGEWGYGAFFAACALLVILLTRASRRYDRAVTATLARAHALLDL